MKAKFITFEGCEGAGKSRQVSLLCSYLNQQKIEYVSTREPGGSKIAENIRNIILDANNTEMSDCCEALLYSAAREQHLKDIILPALNSGKLVICDRYVDSSLAYQGYARNLGVDYIEKINYNVIKNYLPDYTIFLNISSEQAFLRKGGADKNDRLELQGTQFHQKVYEGYLQLAKRYPERYIMIECMGSKEQTHNNILTALRKRNIIK